MPTSKVQAYFDALIQSCDIINEAFQKSSERSLKVSRQIADDLLTGQREALELGKELAADPSNVSRGYEALTTAAGSAQGRSLSLAKLAYEEAIAVGGDTRSAMERLIEANRTVATSAVELTRSWATENPVSGLWSQSLETLSTRPRGGKSRGASG